MESDSTVDITERPIDYLTFDSAPTDTYSVDGLVPETPEYAYTIRFTTPIIVHDEHVPWVPKANSTDHPSKFTGR